MHIMEGFLPIGHAVGWSAVSAICVSFGLRTISNAVKENPEMKMLVGVSAAFIFVLSALKLPSVTGSCSHPTGTGLGAILFGPLSMAPVALVVLLFQAILLAHGGISTLGANVFSMGVAGPFAGYTIFKISRAIKLPNIIAVFLAASIADLATYFTTAFQLASAFPDPVGGFYASLSKFLGIFAFTQLPLALTEGALTVMIFSFIQKQCGNDSNFGVLNMALNDKRA